MQLEIKYSGFSFDVKEVTSPPCWFPLVVAMHEICAARELDVRQVTRALFWMAERAREMIAPLIMKCTHVTDNGRGHDREPSWRRKGQHPRIFSASWKPFIGEHNALFTLQAVSPAFTELHNTYIVSTVNTNCFHQQFGLHIVKDNHFHKQLRLS